MNYVDIILDEYGSVFLIKDHIKLKINNLELYRYFSSFGMSHLQFRKEELPGKLKQFDFEKNKSESYFSKQNSLIDFIKRNYFYDIKLYSDNPKNPIESWENKTEKIKIAKSAEILWSEVANFSSISKSPYYCLLYNLKNTENYILIISKTYFSAIQKMVSYNLNNYFELEDVCCKSIVSKRELIENSININKSKMKLLNACEGSKGYTRRVFKYNNIFVGQLEFHSNIIFSEIALNELSIVKLLDSVESVLSEQLFGKLNWDNLFVVLSDDFNDYLDINESQKYYSNGSLRGLELGIFMGEV